MLPHEKTKEHELYFDKFNSKIFKNKSNEHSVFNSILKKNNKVANGNNSINNLTKNRNNDICSEEKFKKYEWRFTRKDIIWRNVVAITLFHLMSLYAYITFPYFQRLKTLLWGWMVSVIASFGVGAGVHRLWTHRSYKAKTPLRIILLCCYSTAGMNSIFNWVRDHRVHHKFSETDADPHNSTRGFFFSHVGWLMLRKHSEVLRKGRQIDMNDILNDPVVAFGEKYFIPLKIIFCFIGPVIIPVYVWNEDWYYAITTQILMRYAFVLNATWCVNSVAHMFGWRPYDKMIAPTENLLISYVTGGEGWHNYHHAFPWDYKASEMGHPMIDLSTYFIHTFALIGWAYDMKQASPELIKSMVMKKGDGTHSEFSAPSMKNVAVK
ncbi:PREDICTED: stearoyl-CoA desaturase 5-like [Ceratosolen solmsi marchali]|uniref:Stearoyl-CoA desaturase 5-like n=1 Tax=Ceratosolen solmsi marchali TaxID=326594 RepID=A0AAJ6YD80_9HYME|nr:PREDICTED: stearoyl-CoA desaturase 5-like [Ceratosolen solmsi marchali]XP_011495903.1 PREDICTED: stearoyl-CoA desaturase 5-like [Ceratosolen solmsi marchali]